MEKESKHFIKQVEIEEFYSEDDGQIVWNWRLLPVGEWNKQVTPYKEIPWIEYPKFN